MLGTSATRAALLALAIVCLPSTAGAATPPWASKPMAASAAKLQAAADKYAPLPKEVDSPAPAAKASGKKTKGPEKPSILDGEDRVILWSSVALTFAKDGSSTLRTHRISRILTADGVQENKTLEAYWSSWFQDRPTVSARVVDTSGRIHPLDASALNVLSGRVSGDTYSDIKRIVAPLSGIEVGAIVESVVEQKSRAVSMHMGDVHSLWLASSAPIIFMHRRVSAPPGVSFASVVRGSKLKPKTRKKGSGVSMEVNARDVVFEGFLERLRPTAAHDLPKWILSTGGSWQAVAQKYHAVVQKQLSSNSLALQARKLTDGANTVHDKVDRLLAFIRRELRYTSVALGNAAVVPRTPAKTLARRFGDCKDLSTLMVGMLDAVGVKADVALLQAGNDEDVSPGAPGMAMFNHAIVRVRTDKGDLWVDPTAPAYRAGSIPSSDQRRWALIAAPETTALVQIPASEAKATRSQNLYRIGFTDDGYNVIEGAFETVGSWAAYYREQFEKDRRGTKAGIGRYLKERYETEEEPTLTINGDVGPVGYRWTTKTSSWAFLDTEAKLSLDQHGVMSSMPRELLRDFGEPPKAKADESAKDLRRRLNEQRWRDSWLKRKHALVLPTPHRSSETYRVEPPDGFSFERRPQSQTLRMGAATWSRTVKKWGKRGLEIRFDFDSGQSHSPEQVRQFIDAMTKLRDKKTLELKLSLTAKRDLSRGKYSKALRSLKKLYERNLERPQYVLYYVAALVEVGLGEEARRVAKAAVAKHPKSANAWSALGHALRHDELGRYLKGHFDRKGAIAAYTKAFELEPKWAGLVSKLVELHQHNDSGRLYGEGSNPVEVTRLFALLAEKGFAKDDKAHLAAALRVGDPDKLSALARKLEKQGGEVGNLARSFNVAAAGIKGGAKAAIETSKTYGQADAVALVGVSLTLLDGRYRLAYEIAQSLSPRFPQAAQIVAQMAPMVKPAPPAKGACVDATAVMTGLYVSDLPQTVFASDFRPEAKAWQKLIRDGLISAMPMPVPLGRTAESVKRVMVCKEDGTTKKGVRLALMGPPGSGIPTARVFMVKEKGKLRFLPDAQAKLWPLAHLAWKAYKRGDLPSAKTWLAWHFHERARIPASLLRTDPRWRPLLPWVQGRTISDADVPLVSAILLAFSPPAAKTIKVLEAAAATEKDPRQRLSLQLLLMEAYVVLKRGKDLHKVAEKLLASSDSEDLQAALTGLASLARQTNSAADFLKLETAGRALLANERVSFLARGSLHMALSHRGAFAEAAKVFEPLLAQARSNASAANSDLWNRLFDGRDLNPGMERLLRRTEQGAKANSALLHTMACVDVARNKPKSAVEYLRRSLKHRDFGPNEQLVVGLLAEHVGLKAAAKKAYTAAMKDPDVGATSVRAMASKRLQALGATKP